MSGVGSEPVRSCVGCRRRRPRSQLVRLTKSADGIVVDGASDGRGAWLCRRDAHGEECGAGVGVDERCLDAALAKRAFARAWRCEVTSDDEREIRDLVRRRDGVDEPPDAH